MKSRLKPTQNIKEPNMNYEQQQHETADGRNKLVLHLFVVILQPDIWQLQIVVWLQSAFAGRCCHGVLRQLFRCKHPFSSLSHH